MRCTHRDYFDTTPPAFVEYTVARNRLAQANY